MMFNYLKSIKTITSGIKFLSILSLVCFFLASCSVPNALKPKKISEGRPVNADERARQNLEQGRGISLKDMAGGRKSTTYEFSTSNPMWRASLEILDFIPLSTVDYSGGMIITDWYSDTSDNSNESLKITVRFLSNEIRSDSLKIVVHKKNSKTSSYCNIAWKKEKINPISNCKSTKKLLYINQYLLAFVKS